MSVHLGHCELLTGPIRGFILKLSLKLVDKDSITSPLDMIMKNHMEWFHSYDESYGDSYGEWYGDSYDEWYGDSRYFWRLTFVDQSDESSSSWASCPRLLWLSVISRNGIDSPPSWTETSWEDSWLPSSLQHKIKNKMTDTRKPNGENFTRASAEFPQVLPNGVAIIILSLASYLRQPPLKSISIFVLSLNVTYSNYCIPSGRLIHCSSCSWDRISI